MPPLIAYCHNDACWPQALIDVPLPTHVGTRSETRSGSRLKHTPRNHDGGSSMRNMALAALLLAAPQSASAANVNGSGAMALAALIAEYSPLP